MATTSDLGKWMITNGGNYNAEATYEQLTMVMYNNSTYITLKTVTGVTPSNDGVNYILMAQGFEAEALASVTATDTSGLLGDVGETVSAQSLVDYLADAVTTKLLKKTDMSNVQVNDQNKIPTSALAYAMSQDIAGLNSDLETVSESLEQTQKYFYHSSGTAYVRSTKQVHVTNLDGTEFVDIYGKDLVLPNGVRLTNKADYVIVASESDNSDDSIKNDLYQGWNNISVGSKLIRYTNAIQVWSGTIIKYDDSQGSILMHDAGGNIKIYSHYGTVLKTILTQ